MKWAACDTFGKVEMVGDVPYVDAETFVSFPAELTIHTDVPEDLMPGSWYWTGSAFAAVSASPTAFHSWNWTTKQWVLSDLQPARDHVAQIWNVWRDAVLVAGYTHAGHLFHSDDRFLGELQLLLKGYEKGHITGTSNIRTRNNAIIPMSEADIEGLLLLIGLYRQEIYNDSWAGKDALAALTTLDAILAAGPPS